VIRLPSPKLALAAVAAAGVTAPVGIALGADGPSQSQAATRVSELSAPLAGHRSVTGQMHSSALKLRRRADAARRARENSVQAPPILRRIAECESHSNPRSLGSGGLYRGAYQFTIETWHSVGGRGDPAKASMAELTRRAALLLRQSGPSQWPVCSA
jgi:hypothetical protein